MRFHKLDLNLLVALDALLSLKSVSLAAVKLNLSQSAMSNALARLRDYFGDELLVPIGRKFSLTPRALILMGPVREVLIRVETTISSSAEFNPRESPRQFRLFLSDFTMVTLMPHLMSLAFERAPGVRFEFLPQVNEPQRLLERDEADLLIIPDIYCDTSQPSEVLFEEEFCCIAWTGSRHASSASGAAKRSLSLAAYKSSGHVVMKPPGSAPSFEGAVLKQQGIERRVEIETFSFVGVLSLLTGTDRIATVHRRLARYGEQVLPLASFRHPVALPLMRQTMQWQKFRNNDAGLLWLRAIIKEAVILMDSALRRPQTSAHILKRL
jgi:LysR family transcriptional regulator, nod-box dependent transcriptional activator